MRLSFPLEGMDEDFVAQLGYSLGFASEDVVRWEFADDRSELRVEVREGADPQGVREKVEQLVRRYAERKFGLKAVVHFEQRRDLAPFDAWKEMNERRWVTPVGTGHAILRGPAADLLRAVDARVVRDFVREFRAEHEHFPSTILCSTLDRCNHFTSFPEHMDFVAHLREDVDVLKAFSAQCGAEKWSPRAHDGRMGDVEFAITPSCCYHAYEGMEGWDLPEPGRCITAIVGCHRYEGASLTTLSRLRAFTMREVIWVGHPEYVKRSRARADEMIVQWAKDWELDCTLENANDMFFTDDYAVKASFQRQQEAKRELRLTIPQEGRSISVFSSNFHSATFGRAFGIKLAGRPAASGCVGWGLERWVWALVSQFGLEPAGWPAGLRRDVDAVRGRRRVNVRAAQSPGAPTAPGGACPAAGRGAVSPRPEPSAPSTSTRLPDYLIVASVAVHPLSATRFAVEGAFAQHLRELQRAFADRFARIVLAAPRMAPEVYQAARGGLDVLDAEKDRVAALPMHPRGVGPVRYWLLHLLPNLLRLRRAVREAGIVHSGPSHLWRPFECLAVSAARSRGVPTLFVVDVDERRSAAMNRACGRWGLRSYLLARWLYDPFSARQIRSAARHCSLTLLKGRDLCRDFGEGRPSVRFILDAAFSKEHLAGDDAIARRIARLGRKAPLEAVYFGRLTAYKGVDRTLAAVAAVVRERGPVVRLHVVGTGEEDEPLRALAAELGIAEHVSFHGALPYGRPLFERLADCDLLLATPLSEDTPRSALDALAAGMPVLAFDTYYYRDLAESGAVDVVPWPSVEAFARRLGEIAADRAWLTTAVPRAREFAAANSQEEWLERRRRWTVEMLDGARGSV